MRKIDIQQHNRQAPQKNIQQHAVALAILNSTLEERRKIGSPLYRNHSERFISRSNEPRALHHSPPAILCCCYRYSDYITRRARSSFSPVDDSCSDSLASARPDSQPLDSPEYEKRAATADSRASPGIDKRISAESHSGAFAIFTILSTYLHPHPTPPSAKDSIPFKK